MKPRDEAAGDPRSWCLADRVVVVTGASRGLGRSISLAFARAGCRLAMAARDAVLLDDVASEVHQAGGEAITMPTDVRDPDACARMIETAHRHFGAVDVLVNNAGTSIRKRAVETTVDDFDLIVQTNFRGAYFCAVAAGKYMMRQNSGSVVNIASTSAMLVRRGVPNSVYGPSKAAVVMLTKALAEEWASFGIRVNCVAPGRVPTDLSASLASPNSPEDEGLLQTIPMGRLGKPRDITDPVLFLASPLSGYITGQTLFVDGGRTIL